MFDFQSLELTGTQHHILADQVCEVLSHFFHLWSQSSSKQVATGSRPAEIQKRIQKLRGSVTLFGRLSESTGSYSLYGCAL
jgi:hypothetical protein